MQPHQERVVAERQDLKTKIERLSAFTTSEAFSFVGGEERERLRRQLTAMKQYEEVLGERIGAFV
jgi:hypothetical protein